MGTPAAIALIGCGIRVGDDEVRLRNEFGVSCSADHEHIFGSWDVQWVDRWPRCDHTAHGKLRERLGDAAEKVRLLHIGAGQTDHNERVISWWQRKGSLGGDVIENWAYVPHVRCVRRRVVEG